MIPSVGDMFQLTLRFGNKIEEWDTRGGKAAFKDVQKRLILWLISCLTVQAIYIQNWKKKVFHFLHL
jgi:hypothetical protein